MKKLNKIHIMEMKTEIGDYFAKRGWIEKSNSGLYMNLIWFAENLSSGDPEDPEDEKMLSGSVIVYDRDSKKWIFCQFVDGKVKTMMSNFSSKRIPYLLEKYAYGCGKMSVPWCWHGTTTKVLDHVTIRGKRFENIVETRTRDIPGDPNHQYHVYRLNCVA